MDIIPEVFAKNPKTFEEALPLIDLELHKRKPKWMLSAITHLDYDDVSQIIRIHVFNKWHLYDQTRPFLPWINTIISSQMKNIMRNVYWNFERPCLRCAANTGETSCSMTPSQTQCSECPLYAKWIETKKSAHDIKMAVPIENHQQEVYNHVDRFIDMEAQAKKLNKKLHVILKPNEWKLYNLLFIQNKTEVEVASSMGFRTTEVGRKNGYKRIRQMSLAIREKAEKILKEGLD